jgi:chromosome segregation ATPase
MPSDPQAHLNQLRLDLEQKVQQFRADVLQFQNERDAFERRRTQRGLDQDGAIELARVESAKNKAEHARSLDALEKHWLQLQNARESLQEEQRRGEQELATRETELERREKRLAAEEDRLEAKATQHQSDILRLAHDQEALLERQKESQQRLEEIEHLQRESAGLEEQFFQLDEYRAKLIEEAQRLGKQRQEQDEQEAAVLHASIGMEEQQTALEFARSQTEAAAAELLQKEKELHEGRSRHDAAEQQLALRLEELRAREERLESERRALAEQRAQLPKHLTAREHALNAQIEDYQARFVALEDRQAAFDRYEHDCRRKLEAEQLRVQSKEETLQRREADLTGAGDKHRSMLDQVVQMRRALSNERLQFQEEQQRGLAQQAEARATFDVLRRQTMELLRLLPESGLIAENLVERIVHVREQLRSHLSSASLRPHARAEQVAEAAAAQAVLDPANLVDRGARSFA